MMCGHHPCDKPDCTHGEAHRAACEARTVIRMPQDKVSDFYGRVKSARGEAAYQRLVADVSAEYQKSTEVAR